MAGTFLLSLDEVSLDRNSFRDWEDLLRSQDWRIRAKFIERLVGFLDRLPPLEHDIIHLTFFARPPKKQEVISAILGISQQAVSHRMSCAFKRIKFMMAQPEIEPAKMRTDLASLLKNRFTVDVLCDFAFTSSQTVTARNLGNVSQQRVCWHLTNGILALKACNNLDAMFYIEYLENLMRHRNILREVLAGRRRKEHVRPDEQRYFDIATSSRGASAEGGGTPYRPAQHVAEDSPGAPAAPGSVNRPPGAH